MRHLILSLLACLTICTNSFGQQLDQKLTIVFNKVNLEEALFQLMDEHNVPLLFRNDVLPKKTIHNTFKDYQLSDILDHILSETNLSYRIFEEDILIEIGAPKVAKKEILISGRLYDEESGEYLIGASVYIPTLSKGTYTNEYGQFSLALPPGKWEINFSHVAYTTSTLPITFKKDTILSVALEHNLVLKQYILWDTGKALQPIPVDIDWENEQIDLESMKELPRLGGEEDIIRSLHLFSGVQSGTDGVGGLFIRGGNAGHNLIMVDGVPIYNVNHAAGLLSVFNPSVIKTAKFLKGAYPARYEGRLSSVLDIRTRDGNFNEFEGQVDVGLLSGRVSLEGPLGMASDKASFLIAGRWSYLNQFIQPRVRSYKIEQGEEGASTYDFFDFNAKFNYQFSPRNKLYLSYYRGGDDFDNFGTRVDRFTLLDQENNTFLPFRLFQDYREEVDWGNEVFALRWNTELHPKLFGNATLTYSTLNLRFGSTGRDSTILEQPYEVLDFGEETGWYNSSIEDIAFKLDFDWHPSLNHYIRFGLKAGQIYFQPGITRFNALTSEFDDENILRNRAIKSHELSLYLENTQQIGRDLSLNYGFHLSGNHVDQQSYLSFQPRLSMYWESFNNFKIKASVRKATQFLHLLSSSAIGLPTDLWVPSTGLVKPAHSWQYALGFRWEPNMTWMFEVEPYYKKMYNIVSYSEGVSFLDEWENNVSSGQGEAYGIDFSLRKKAGQTTGWISYSYAFANRQFDDINLGDPFPFTYDRRHDFKMALIHRLPQGISLSANFLYGTGTAISLPTQQFSFRLPGPSSIPVTALYYGRKNQFRLPSYHRLDVGVNFHFEKWGFQHHLYLGVTNTYDQSNPLYYRLRLDDAIISNQFTEFRQFVGVELLPFLPSFNYSVKF